MRALIQRTDGVELFVEDRLHASLHGPTLLVLLGLCADDGPQDADYIVRKLPELRIFDDPNGKMNLSARDVGAGLFLVSQFTLYARCRRGNRPNFMDAAKPEKAKPLYAAICERLAATGLPFAKGVFGAHMRISMKNDGPVTILMDSREL